MIRFGYLKILTWQSNFAIGFGFSKTENLHQPKILLNYIIEVVLCLFRIQTQVRDMPLKCICIIKRCLSCPKKVSSCVIVVSLGGSWRSSLTKRVLTVTSLLIMEICLHIYKNESNSRQNEDALNYNKSKKNDLRVLSCKYDVTVNKI